MPLSYNPTIAPLRSSTKPRRARSKFLIRYVVPSDTHGFIGRIFDLSAVTLHFDNYDALAVYPDCKYAIDVNEALIHLVTRVESLNIAGNMLWPEPMLQDFGTFPLSRHEWLTVTADVFLMRYISVVDCALLVISEVFELGLNRRACTLGNVRKKKLPLSLDQTLSEMVRHQEALRLERNARVHHGDERPFTPDNTTFKIVAIFERSPKRMTGQDCFGRSINLDRMLNEGLVELQRAFNRSARNLAGQLDRLYDDLWREFESRFGPRLSAASHGLNANRAR